MRRNRLGETLLELPRSFGKRSAAASLQRSIDAGRNIGNVRAFVKSSKLNRRSPIMSPRAIGGELRIVMGHTGMYWRPITLAFQKAGFFISVSEPRAMNLTCVCVIDMPIVWCYASIVGF